MIIDRFITDFLSRCLFLREGHGLERRASLDISRWKRLACRAAEISCFSDELSSLGTKGEGFRRGLLEEDMSGKSFSVNTFHTIRGFCAMINSPVIRLVHFSQPAAKKDGWQHLAPEPRDITACPMGYFHVF